MGYGNVFFLLFIFVFVFGIGMKQYEYVVPDPSIMSEFVTYGHSVLRKYYKKTGLKTSKKKFIYIIERNDVDNPRG